MLLRIREAAERLHVSLPTLRRLIKTGVVPVVVLKRGTRRRLLRIRTEALERVVRGREERAGGALRGVNSA